MYLFLLQHFEINSVLLFNKFGGNLKLIQFFCSINSVLLLTAINSSSGPVLDKMRKNIIALFKNEGLSITIETDLFETAFLDVTFNLATGKFFPFIKSNNQPLYINAKSNHPPNILRDLPSMIHKR